LKPIIAKSFHPIEEKSKFLPRRLGVFGMSIIGAYDWVRQLEYKKWYGRTVVTIDKFNPSSKRRFECGHAVPKMPLPIHTGHVQSAEGITTEMSMLRKTS